MKRIRKVPKAICIQSSPQRPISVIRWTQVRTSSLQSIGGDLMNPCADQESYVRGRGGGLKLNFDSVHYSMKIRKMKLIFLINNTLRCLHTLRSWSALLYSVSSLFGKLYYND